MKISRYSFSIEDLKYISVSLIENYNVPKSLKIEINGTPDLSYILDIKDILNVSLEDEINNFLSLFITKSETLKTLEYIKKELSNEHIFV